MATNAMPRLPPKKVFARMSNSIIIFVITQFTVMSDKEFQMLIELAEAELKKGCTQEEARRSLYDAGIYDKNGNFTKPYKHLEILFPRK
jgi:hypothetical protein